VRGRIVPDPNAELLIYQTLVGIWPAPRPGRRAVDIPERAWRTAAMDRMKQYVLKAVREAKLRTSWTDPDLAYERTLLEFVGRILDGHEDDPFLSDLSRLVARIAPIAQWNTLSRILLHLTIPGTPDIYQGDEAWNFALVDPDNRREVNYTARRSSLGAVQSKALGSVADIVADVNAKTWLTHRVLEARRARPELFADGSYQPLVVRGPRSNHIVAFERCLGDQRAIIIDPRLVGAITDWSGTSVQLDDPVKSLRCVLTGREGVVRDGRIELDEVPIALMLDGSGTRTRTE
jgi:(1->4)-alpha-D-glucan 1-alpha-D-glucosylmutase